MLAILKGLQLAVFDDGTAPLGDVLGDCTLEEPFLGHVRDAASGSHLLSLGLAGFNVELLYFFLFDINQLKAVVLNCNDFALL